MGSQNKNAVCFIATSNYLPHLQTVIGSLCKYDRDFSFYILNPGDDIRADQFSVPVQIMTLEDIGFTNLEFVKRLEVNSPFELACMMKAPFMQSLFENEEIEKLFYCDTDLYFTGSLKDFVKDLDSASIVLTPHLLVPASSNTIETLSREALTVAAGIFNMGFFGLRRSPETEQFLEWWKTRVFFRCKRDLIDGFYDDQKWADQIPIIFDNVAVSKRFGANVANWNLHERDLSMKGNRYFVCDEPLLFFHFSRFRPDVPYRLSEFEDIMTDSNPALNQLCDEYASLMLKNGWQFLRSKQLSLIMEI